MSRSTPLGRRLALATGTVVISAGLLSGVASADASTPEASTTSGVASSLTGSSSVDTKRAIADIFNCKYHPFHPWCRGR
ncbi:hypothetical protein ACT3SZ_10355 [Corynebacterium sp. AOP40-9SA-29]|uniref:hypothetical protein n=1 Tax=Corynebacterium sp. AOP40-9SA-29 TaxID=3457677 RepID=UPI004034CF16